MTTVSLTSVLRHLCGGTGLDTAARRLVIQAHRIGGDGHLCAFVGDAQEDDDPFVARFALEDRAVIGEGAVGESDLVALAQRAFGQGVHAGFILAGAQRLDEVVGDASGSCAERDKVGDADCVADGFPIVRFLCQAGEKIARE